MQASDAPIIGPWISKIGRMTNIYASPCNIEPIVYVQGFFHSTPYMIWSLFAPDCIDERKSLFPGPTPPGGQPPGSPHGSKRRGRFIGSGPPKAGAPKGMGKLMTTAFKAAELAERIGWYFLIADAGIEGALNWTTAMYTWEGCPVPSEADGYSEILTSWVGIGDHPDERAQWQPVSSGPGVVMTPIGAVVASGYTPSVAATVSVAPIGEGTASLSKLQILRDGVPVSNAVTPDPDKPTNELLASYTPIDLISPTTTYEVRYGVVATGQWHQSAGFLQVFTKHDLVSRAACVLPELG